MNMKNYNPEENTEKKLKDPTEAELIQYAKNVKIKAKQSDIKNGAKEFNFEDGFNCIARDQKNADRKHQNWLKLKTF